MKYKINSKDIEKMAIIMWYTGSAESPWEIVRSLVKKQISQAECDAISETAYSNLLSRNYVLSKDNGEDAVTKVYNGMGECTGNTVYVTYCEASSEGGVVPDTSVDAEYVDVVIDFNDGRQHKERVVSSDVAREIVLSSVADIVVLGEFLGAFFSHIDKDYIEVEVN